MVRNVMDLLINKILKDYQITTDSTGQYRASEFIEAVSIYWNFFEISHENLIIYLKKIIRYLCIICILK